MQQTSCGGCSGGTNYCRLARAGITSNWESRAVPGPEDDGEPGHLRAHLLRLYPAFGGAFRERESAPRVVVAFREGILQGMPDVIRFTPDVADAILDFGATGSSAVHLGSGSGESHAYVFHFDPDGEIGMHEAGFDQLFLVVSGEAWLTVEGDTVELRSGEAGVVPRGSMHSKGSRSGGTAVMVQMLDMTRD